MLSGMPVAPGVPVVVEAPVATGAPVVPVAVGPEVPVLGGLTLIPSFHALADFTNPGLVAFSRQNPITIAGGACTFSLFAKPLSDCDRARNFFSRNGLSYTSVSDSSGTGVVTTIGDTQLVGFDEAKYKKTLDQAGFTAAPGSINYAGAIAVVVWLSALIGMVYGPMAAFLVEMFPANIRATSLSMPYHLGVGILGGFLPFAASALVIYQGNIFAGLWYPVSIALATAVAGLMPRSIRKPRIWLITPVRWPTRRERTRCNSSRSICSGVLIDTKRMVGRCTASAIASASR